MFISGASSVGEIAIARLLSTATASGWDEDDLVSIDYYPGDMGDDGWDIEGVDTLADTLPHALDAYLHNIQDWLCYHLDQDEIRVMVTETLGNYYRLVFQREDGVQ